MNARKLLLLACSLVTLQTPSLRAQTPGETPQVQRTPFPAMAPLQQYLMPEDSEVTLARSSAPTAISGAAEVMVLRPEGYVTVAKGTNGFLCIVERSWAKPTSDPEFWNPKVRAPNCFNPAARTFAEIYLMKTRLVLAGKPKTDILAATNAAFSSRQLPPLAPGAMCYMMSRQQYLSDDDMSWHPHLMFFTSSQSPAAWGANLPGSPLIAGPDPEERATIFMVVVAHWSDGTPAASASH